MELKKELEQLKNYLDTFDEENYKKQSDYIQANFTSEKEQEEINQ